MVEKKFNFYNFYSVHYKNINKTVIYQYINDIKDFNIYRYVFLNAFEKFIIIYINDCYFLKNFNILRADFLLYCSILHKKKKFFKKKILIKRLYKWLFLPNYKIINLIKC